MKTILFSLSLFFYAVIATAQSSRERDISEWLNQYIEIINTEKHSMTLAAEFVFEEFNSQLVEIQQKEIKNLSTQPLESPFVKDDDDNYYYYWPWTATYCCNLSLFFKNSASLKKRRKAYTFFSSLDLFINPRNEEDRTLLKTYANQLSDYVEQGSQILKRANNLIDSINTYLVDRVYIEDRIDKYKKASALLIQAEKISTEYADFAIKMELFIQDAFKDLIKKESKSLLPLKNIYAGEASQIAAWKRLFIELKHTSVKKEQNRDLLSIKAYKNNLPNTINYLKTNDSIKKWIQYLDVYHNNGECCLSAGFYQHLDNVDYKIEHLLKLYDNLVSSDSSTLLKCQNTTKDFIRSINELVKDYNEDIRVFDGPILKHTILYDPFQALIPEFEDPIDPTTAQFGDADPINLTILVDVSASMNEAEKLPLIKETIYWLASLLRPTDYLTVVTYADNPIVYINKMPGKKSSKIKKTITLLKAAGKTDINKALPVALEMAWKNFETNATNKVILFTDGLFNIDQKQKEIIESHIYAGITLSVFYFGKKEKNKETDLLKIIALWGKGYYYYITRKNIQSILFNELK